MGAAIGSPISPIVANIFMEAFENRAITTGLHPPRIWKRYVDDTFVLQHQAHKEEFLQHINTVDPSIQFTVEEAKRRWFYTLPRYNHKTRGRWNLYNRGV